MMLNKYLFTAYSLVWVIFMLYAWSLARRYSGLRQELHELKSKIQPK